MNLHTTAAWCAVALRVVRGRQQRTFFFSRCCILTVWVPSLPHLLSVVLICAPTNLTISMLTTLFSHEHGVPTYKYPSLLHACAPCRYILFFSSRTCSTPRTLYGRTTGEVYHVISCPDHLHHRNSPICSLRRSFQKHLSRTGIALYMRQTSNVHILLFVCTRLRSLMNEHIRFGLVYYSYPSSSFGFVARFAFCARFPRVRSILRPCRGVVIAYR